MLKKIFFFIIIAGCCQSLKAQILTVDLTDTAAYAKKTVCKGSLSLGLEGDKQKTLLLDGTNVFNFQLQHYKELLILAASYRFTNDGDQNFLNSGFVHLRWRHDYKNTWQPETFVQYQWDGSRGMLDRFLIGENARYTFWHKKNWELSIATGVMYEAETWNYNGVDTVLKPLAPNNQMTSLLKSNNYVKLDGKTSANSDLSFIVFYQAPFKSFFDTYRIATSAKFEVAFAKHFDFAIAFSSLYDSKPVVPITKFYYNFSNGIVYKF
ncbi:DUF481 domain-containing protein [Ferruginibacter lapsinanis]|uniref:DUF481 domain-containing protein n=1 Tax=Ferruginibacter lapsinanis TaxID=563172 RepID=UPI001E4DEFA8|nr:DUF481 domain-containing protein [Ferruginibacter lapsinanis]UEG49224.1 DUF481 domain-containing protein [Ferruginibacter lapsinanis]